MVRILLYICLLIYAHFAAAQTPFERAIDLNFESEGRSIIAADSGSWLVGGYQSKCWRPSIIKFTAIGEVEWEMAIYNSWIGYGRVSALARAQNGEYLGLITGREGDDYGHDQTVVFRFNTDSNVIWSTGVDTLEGPSNNYGSFNITELIDESILISSGGNYIVKLSMLGDSLWLKSYSKGVIYSLESTLAGGAIAACELGIVEIDVNGNEIKQKQVNEKGLEIHQFKDSSYVFVTGQHLLRLNQNLMTIDSIYLLGFDSIVDIGVDSNYIWVLGMKDSAVKMCRYSSTLAVHYCDVFGNLKDAANGLFVAEDMLGICGKSRMHQYIKTYQKDGTNLETRSSVGISDIRAELLEIEWVDCPWPSLQVFLCANLTYKYYATVTNSGQDTVRYFGLNAHLYQQMNCAYLRKYRLIENIQLAPGQSQEYYFSKITHNFIRAWEVRDLLLHCVFTTDPNGFLDMNKADDSNCGSVPIGIGVVKPYRQVSIYPNPISNHLIIELEGGEAEFQMYNLLGQQILKVKIQNTLDISLSKMHLSSGLYIYKLTDSDRVLKNGKLVVE